MELTCPAPKKWDPSGTNKIEAVKSWPNRFPGNGDSLGIELVGAFDATKNSYVSVAVEQNASLKWLVAELKSSLSLSTLEIFRHPDVSYKQSSEASTANWK